MHFLQPMHSRGSTSTRLKIGASGFSTSYMHKSTGHSVMQIGDPPHPVQASLITAINLGLRFLCTDLFAFSATAIFQLFLEKLIHALILPKSALMYIKFPTALQAFGGKKPGFTRN
jgi:hypothetical protein